MGMIFNRLQSDERWWAADAVLRAFGLGLLGLCITGSQWLCRSVQKAPDHSPMPVEILVAILAFLSWSIGWACLVEGQSLFRLIHVPGRHGSLSL